MTTATTSAGPAFWEPLYEAFQLELRTQRETTSSSLQQAKAALPICRSFILRLRHFIQGYQFAHVEEEIQFFKAVKPLFYQEYIYYLLLYNVLLRQPIGRLSHQQQYWRQELAKLEQFYQDHQEFYLYWRKEEVVSDDLYFLRSSLRQAETVDALNQEEGFNSFGDYWLSRMLAQERLVVYLNGLLKEAHASPAEGNGIAPLQWTASKTDLVELVYALQAGGVFNNGQATVKEIVSLLESVLRIELGNYYNTFNEIRMRKKVRLTLLEEMRKKLLERMVELD